MTKNPSATPGRISRSTILLLPVLVLAMLAIGACSDDGEPYNYNRPPAEERRMWLFDVTGNGANDVYVSGNLGVMFHFDGADWSLQDMGTTAAITTVWSPPTESTVYAVGHGGNIWRNTGSGWSGMTSNTKADLYGIGLHANAVHAVGADGTILKLGGSWSGVGGTMFQLDENGAPIDTLATSEDLSSMLCVNHYFLGGAYYDPKFEGPRFGIDGTRGNVLAPNTDETLDGPWILRPLSGDALVDEEWIYCMTSDPAALDRNYLGTSEGWLFRLTRDDDGNNVWQKFFPEFTDDPGAGIRDIWVDDANNVYLVTDEGEVWYQTADYNFSDGTGSRALLYDDLSSLVGIWGSGPDNIYFVGYFDEKIFHGVHDTGAGTFTVTEIPLVFPGKSAAGGSLEAGLNEKGLPLHR